MTVKHIIFDLFGTLADSDKSCLLARRGQLMHFGSTRWMVQDRPEEEFFPTFCKGKDIDPQALAGSFRQMERTTAFFPGIPELLRELKAEGFSLHLLSNTGRTVKAFIESNEDVCGLFATKTFSFEIGAVKPDERMFRAVLDKVGAAPEECLMIGDSPDADIAPAERLGMRTVRFQGRRESVDDLHARIASATERP